MIPPEYEELKNHDGLFYWIDSDGICYLTGEKIVCMINETLKDGSKIIGGINRQFLLFGDRFTAPNTSTPLRWYEAARGRLNARPTVAKPPPLAATPPSPPPSLPKTKPGIDNPIFDRDRNRDYDRYQVEQAPTHIPTTQVNPEQKKLLRDNLKKGAQGNVTALENIGQLVEEAMTDVEKVRGENNALRNELETLRGQVNYYKNDASTTREKAQKVIDDTVAKYEKRLTVRHWQVEAVREHALTTEGMESRVLEVEDPEGKMRYVVVSCVPPGTEDQVKRQWELDLRSKVDMMPFGQRAVYLTAPPKTSIAILEIVPGVNVEGETQTF